VPHPNVVLFDVRVGWLTLALSRLLRGCIATCGSISGEECKVKIPTLPKSGEGWGTLESVLIEIVHSITQKGGPPADGRPEFAKGGRAKDLDVLLIPTERSRKSRTLGSTEQVP